MVKVDLSSKHASFRSIQKYGYLLGGIGPILFFIALESAGFSQNMTDKNSILAILFLFVIGAGLGFIALALDLDHFDKVWFKLFYSFQAFFSILLIHLLVMYTGGAKTSVFAFSYLYLPAIVGYVYGRGNELKVASFFLTISYFLNLGFCDTQKVYLDRWLLSERFTLKESPESYDAVMYIVIFIIELGVTIAFAKKNDPPT